MRRKDVEVSQILRHYYHIYPEYIEDYGKVKKVYTAHRAFALKKIKKTGAFFLPEILTFLALRGYSNYAPIIQTVTGDIAVYTDDSIYYVMPWVYAQNERQQRNIYKSIMEELAQLHKISAITIDQEQEVTTALYETLLSDWNARQQLFHQFISECEQKHFMSPFELFYCLHFQQIMRQETTYFQFLEKWHEKKRNTEKTRQVLCHNHLDISHFLAGANKNYFLSFEKAGFASPVHDLCHYFAQTIIEKNTMLANVLDEFHLYYQYFPLTEDEMLMFYYSMLDTTRLADHIKIYRTAKVSELKSAQVLQKLLWYYQDANYVVEQLRNMITFDNNDD